MIEGAGSKEYPHLKGMLYGDPDTMHALMNHLADTVADYLNAQILAGAQAVQIFDTWAVPYPLLNTLSSVWRACSGSSINSFENMKDAKSCDSVHQRWRRMA